MTVTADDGGSGESESLLGADNVDNTLTLVTHTEIGEAEILHIFLQGGALQTGVVLFDEFVDILEVFAGGGRDVLEIQELGIDGKWTPGGGGGGTDGTYVVDGDQCAVRPADFSAGILEAFKGLLWWWSVRFVVGIRARGDCDLLEKSPRGRDVCLQER